MDFIMFLFQKFHSINSTPVWIFQVLWMEMIQFISGNDLSIVKFHWMILYKLDLELKNSYLNYPKRHWSQKSYFIFRFMFICPLRGIKLAFQMHRLNLHLIRELNKLSEVPLEVPFRQCARRLRNWKLLKSEG